MLAEAIVPEGVHSKALPDLVTKLYLERGTLLRRLHAIDLRPRPIAERLHQLEELCQSLVDYFALGHFEVFTALRTHRHGTRLRRLLSELDDPLADTARIAVEFNDRYGGERTRRFDQLPRDIEQLRAALVARLELEDRLLATLRA